MENTIRSVGKVGIGCTVHAHRILALDSHEIKCLILSVCFSCE